MAGGAKVERRRSTSLSNVDCVQKQIDPHAEIEVDRSASRSFMRVGTVQVLCGVALYLGLWILPGAVGGFSLTLQPVETLRICIALTCPVVVVAFSTLRLQPETYPAWWAAFRGFLSLPVGIVVASFLATVFGAAISYESAVKTLHWGALLSTLTVVPMATVYGGSWPTWHRLFALTKPDGPLELALCLPAHGAAIGSWVGAWPMPLDWERPWQEWPVCCTYGAVGGYLLSLFVSFLWNSVNLRESHQESKKVN